ncbi:PepSY-associated TM helix domain-containing protein [Bradyrhizobium sp. 930_D9_N1_4]|uniref:PepSY-associated TM helix domain-containing protein n=1 Tax=Bradyrhizobium sp. 930_D9_N1_4 TaxID=3240374 RepID=UPI003F89A88F
MTRAALRRWLWVHKWSSLVCTVFLLVVCVTGLPLVFSDEINDFLYDGLPYANVPPGTANASLDTLAASARRLYPSETILSIFVDDDEPKAIVFMAPSLEAYAANRKVGHAIRLDSRTAEPLKQSKPINQADVTFMGTMLRLHKDLFADLPGELFMAGMAALFVIALVSGGVVYGPFMRKLEFGSIRTDRSRAKWLDYHNMVGVILLAWMLVVGVTGVINELTTPIFALWQKSEVQAMLNRYKGRPTPAESELSSPQAAFDVAATTVRHMNPMSVIYPGSPFGTPTHYIVWMRGDDTLTSRLRNAVLVDAKTGHLEGQVKMPWYLLALQVSRPLHFGDYGGLPLKILWAFLDIATIMVLSTGIYLWLRRGRQSQASLARGVASATMVGEAAE